MNPATTIAAYVLIAIALVLTASGHLTAGELQTTLYTVLTVERALAGLTHRSQR